MVFTDCIVMRNDKIAPNIFDMTISEAKLSSLCLPGQFLHIKCGDANLLRRPISVCDAHDGCVRIVYEAKGNGTNWLARCAQGNTLDILGPLGNGFEIESESRVLLIGGGIGVPPMLYTAKKLLHSDMIMGFRSRENVILEDEFRAVCQNTLAVTDDGSYGLRGHAGMAAGKMLDENKYGMIYACGPKVMLRAVAQIAAEREIPCFISMEERMGCGVGACLVCACRVRGENGDTYKHVCKDGPVFDARDVIFDD